VLAAPQLSRPGGADNGLLGTNFSVQVPGARSEPMVEATSCACDGSTCP